MQRTFRIKVNDHTYTVRVGDTGRSPVAVEVDGQVFQVELEEQASQQRQPVSQPTPVQAPVPSAPAVASAPVVVSSNQLAAPMPGKVVAVHVKMGDRVSQGDVVCVLDAMKMEQLVKAGRDGVVAAVRVEPGQTVGSGTILLEFET